MYSCFLQEIYIDKYMFRCINKIMPYVFPIFVLGMLFAYYYIDTSKVAFPLHCVWNDLTGTDCPSCGTQRALHSLMHCRIKEALSYNIFFVISVPYALLAVISTWYNYHGLFDRVKTYIFRSYILKLYVILFFSWWIVRNILSI